MQIYDETSSAAAVQWMTVVRQHLQSVEAIRFMQGLLTSTCTATAQLLRWLHDTINCLLENAPDIPAAADSANNASLLYFVLLKHNLNRVCAEAGISTQPLSVIRHTHVRTRWLPPHGSSYSLSSGRPVSARLCKQPSVATCVASHCCGVPGRLRGAYDVQQVQPPPCRTPPLRGRHPYSTPPLARKTAT